MSVLSKRSLPLVVMVAVACSGAAASQPLHFGYEEWREAVARRGVDPDEAVYPFRATDEMRNWASSRLTTYASLGVTKRLLALQEELFDGDSFNFVYDESLTLTAEEAFRTRRGNCMSFTALFISLSRAVGVPTKLVSVRRSPEVMKDNGLVVVNRHVVAGYQTSDRMHVFDFYVTSAAPYMHQRVIDDVHASAMFHTNLGGAAIRAGDLDEATRHLQIATALTPEWGAAWVNLGVTRYRLGDSDGAMEAYRKALEVDPDNSSALTNMAYIHRRNGNEDAARAALQAAAQTTSNPFTLVAMADVEMMRGNYSRAHHYLRRAKWWYKKEPEVYEALARLSRLEGEADKAMRYSLKARRLRAEAAQEETH